MSPSTAVLLALWGAVQDPAADPLAAARAWREQGKAAEALQAFTRLAGSGPHRELAHLERAATYFQMGRFEEANLDYEGFLLRFPQSERLGDAKRGLMESALQLAKTGATGWFGIPTGAGYGIDRLKEALRRYPREECSSDFSQKLGKFYYDRAEWDLAAEWFGIVLSQYGDGPDAVVALYMLGRCAEQRFDAIDYEARPLVEARRYYERFIDEEERMRRLPDPARGWVDLLLPNVKERLTGIYEKLLAKRLKVADYYEWKGLPKSARLTYAAIVKEDAVFRKVLPAFPQTEALRRSRKRLAEIRP
jgi:outer membrane protein assembly factor BamD (BamD/ComL family)